jgi:hypothetical protein
VYSLVYGYNVRPLRPGIWRRDGVACGSQATALLVLARLQAVGYDVCGVMPVIVALDLKPDA